MVYPAELVSRSKLLPLAALAGVVAVFAPAATAKSVELQNTGDPANRSEFIASIEHALCEQPGDWICARHDQENRRLRA
jgi:hypothetical protein